MPRMAHLTLGPGPLITVIRALREVVPDPCDQDFADDCARVLAGYETALDDLLNGVEPTPIKEE